MYVLFSLFRFTFKVAKHNVSSTRVNSTVTSEWIINDISDAILGEFLFWPIFIQAQKPNNLFVLIHPLWLRKKRHLLL